MFQYLNFFIIVFLIIYGPVLDTFLGPLLDVSFLISLCIIIYGSIWQRNVFTDKFVIQLGYCVIIILILTLLNSLFLDSSNIEHSSRALLRPVRIVPVFVAIAIFSIYFVRKNHTQSIDIIVSLIFLAVTVHALIMIVQFFSIDFRNYIYQFTSAKYVLEVYQATRMAGLTGAGGAQLSIIQSLGLVLGVFLFIRLDTIKSKVLIIFSCQFILVSIFLAGRSGFLTALLFCPSYFIYLSFLDKTNHTGKNVLVILSSMIFVILISVSFLYENLSNNVFFVSAFERIFDTFIGFRNGGEVKVNTLTALSKMFILPDEPLHLLFGKSSYLNNNTLYDINTDIGYFRIIWGYGVFGSFFHYAFYVLAIYQISKLRNITHIERSLPIILILIILFFNSKEILVFSRLSFQITMLVLFVTYFSNKCVHAAKKAY